MSLVQEKPVPGGLANMAVITRAVQPRVSDVCHGRATPRDRGLVHPLARRRPCAPISNTSATGCPPLKALIALYGVAVTGRAWRTRMQPSCGRQGGADTQPCGCSAPQLARSSTSGGSGRGTMSGGDRCCTARVAAAAAAPLTSSSIGGSRCAPCSGTAGLRCGWGRHTRSVTARANVTAMCTQHRAIRRTLSWLGRPGAAG